MRFVKFVLALTAVAGATIATELSMGQRAMRARQDEMLAEAAVNLEQLPVTIGDWQMESRSEVSPEVVGMLECRGQICRTYLNQKTGRTVNVMVLAGPAGPLVAHRPEVCMDGQGYRILSGPQRVEMGHAGDELFRTTFSVRSSRRRVIVYYGWARSDRYEAPAWPRLTLGREPMLYRIQVSSVVEERGRAEERDAGWQFIDDSLPVLSQVRSSPVLPASSESPPDSKPVTKTPSWLSKIQLPWN